MAGQHGVDPVQILRPSHMERNEGCVWMPAEHPIARFQQRLETRKVAAVEAPVRMLVQLFIALVAAVNRMEKSFGVTGMNEDRDAQAAGLFPDGIQARVVDGEELARLVAHP